mgnify:FL=1
MKKNKNLNYSNISQKLIIKFKTILLFSLTFLSHTANAASCSTYQKWVTR